MADRVGDIVSTQATSQDHRNACAHRLHDASTNIPVVNATGSADARDIRIVRVEQEVVTERSETLGGGNCLVGGLRPADLDRLHHSHAARKERTQLPLLLDAQRLGRRTNVDDRRVHRIRHRDDGV